MGKVAGATGDAGGRLNAAGAAATRFSSAATSAVIPLAAAGLAINSFSKAAADVAEAQNKASVVFGQSQGTIDDFAKTSANAYGLSRRAALEYTGTLGTILQAGGLAQDATAGMSVDLVKLASDMASFNNIPIDQALEKIRSGLVGETEPLRTVGVLLNETTVKNKAYAMGLAATGAVLTEGQKVQARYALILEQTGKAQGDFARTSGGLANQQRIVAAQFENLRADIGTKLVPVLLKLLSLWNKLPGEVQVALVIFGGFGLLIAPAVIAIGTMIAALVALVPALISVGVAMVVATGGLILLIPALIAIGVAVYVFRDQIMDVFNTVLGFIQSHQTQIAAIIAVLFPFAIPLMLAFKFRDEIRVVFQAIVGFIRGHQAEIAAVIAVLFPFIIPLVAAFRFRDEIAGAFNSVKTVVADLLNFVSGAMSQVGGAFIGPAQTIITWVQYIIDRIYQLIEAIGRIPGGIIGGIGDVVGAGGGILNKLRAAGGPVMAGQSYFVGERGMELFTPRTSGSIIPNHALGGGGATLNVYLTVQGGQSQAQSEREGRRIADAARRALRHSG